MREENILAKAQDTAKYLHEKLQATFLNHQNVGEIRHLGLINAIELVKDKDKKEAFDSKKRLGYQIYKNALQKGLLLRPLGDVLYFNPPLNIDKQTLDKAISICHTSIKLKTIFRLKISLSLNIVFFLYIFPYNSLII